MQVVCQFIVCSKLLGNERWEIVGQRVNWRMWVDHEAFNLLLEI